LAKLNSKNIFKINKRHWKLIATEIKDMIRADMIAGRVQEYGTQERPTKNGAKKYSTQYAQYKSNNFKRFTKDKFTKTDIGYGFNEKLKTISGRKRAGISNKGFSTGNRLKQYAGKSIRSNHASSVNMMVTGQTIEGLHLEQILENGIIMSYEKADEMKIRGNAERGRFINTLSPKNRERVLEMYSEALDESLRNWAKEKIVIKIGK